MDDAGLVAASCILSLTLPIPREVIGVKRVLALLTQFQIVAGANWVLAEYRLLTYS